MTDAEIFIMRCDSCGDTFPIHEGDDKKCPSCGNEDTHLATEPLL